MARVDLQMKTGRSDWLKIGQAYGEINLETLTLQSTLQLTKGRKIRLILKDGAINDCNEDFFCSWTNFVGWLIEEDFLINNGFRSNVSQDKQNGSLLCV